MQTAIVIVSYNGARWLENCLKSCQNNARGVPIFVVDNASADKSAEIATSFPEVTVLQQESNRGFAGGNNVGITAAINDGAEAVFLLNQDAEITSGCLDLLVEYLKNNPVVGGVQPAILLPDGRVNSLGNSFHFLGFAEAAGNGLTMEEAKQKVPWLKNNTEPPYLSGAALLLRSEALQQVGLFNEELFMYHEDLELSLRLRGAGWRLAVAPAARAVHYYEPSRSRQQYYYMERNRLIVWNEMFHIRTLLLFLPIFLLSEIALLFNATLSGWLKEKLRSYLYFLRPASWFAIGLRRRQWQQRRQLSDSKMLSFASATINYQGDDVGVWSQYFYNPLATLVWFIIRPLIRW